MNIIVRGGSKHQQKCVYSITKYCIQTLMPRMRTIEVNINICNFSNDSAYGYCVPSDYADIRRPREFDIELNKTLPLSELLVTAGHELVHVKQYARGELYQSTVTRKHRWQGIWQNDNVAHAELPWEIEAYDKEPKLYNSWCKCNSDVQLPLVHI